MKQLVLAASLVAMVYVGWRWQQVAPVETTSPKLVFNRFWVDHLPTGERDTFKVFVVSRPESIGAFAEESMWHGEIERFRFESDGDEIWAVFPWSGQREQITVIATPCDEADMDFCLEMRGSSHGVKRYYSRTGWERRGVEDIATFRAQLRLDRAR